MNETVQSILLALVELTQGLLFASESDEPFTVFCRPIHPFQMAEPINEEVIRDRFGYNEGDKIEEIDSRIFFSRLRKYDQELTGGNKKTDLEALQILFEERLKGKLFQINNGKVRVTYVLMGKFDKYYVGLQTIGTET